MFFKVLLVLFLLIKLAASNDESFTLNGTLNLGGVAKVTQDGLLMLTDERTLSIGHAFHSVPLRFKNSSTGNSISFSTTFVFAIVPKKLNLNGPGMAFVISPSEDMSGALPAQHLGMFNHTTNGKSSNHIVAIELDTFQNEEFEDFNDNHVGIDINGLKSVESTPAGYFTNEEGEFENLTLVSGEEIQIWVDYDAIGNRLNVTLSPIGLIKPDVPLLSLEIDISSVILDHMYVGFSSSTSMLVQSHYVLGWSFQLNGKAQEIDISQLPSLPANEQSKKNQTVLAIGLSLAGVVLVSVTIFMVRLLVRRNVKCTETLEDWEVNGLQKFLYQDLFEATKGFKESELLGKGGFGQVYRGVLPVTNEQVAVKRISHDSKQGMNEFISEIRSIGRLQHPNLVPLLGYSQLKGELLLVYEFMPNASLDKFLFNKPQVTLNWQQRFKIIKDVASGLVYLHEVLLPSRIEDVSSGHGWREVQVQGIVHRDIKASNVLLDGEFNGKLSDFGLARCSYHAQHPPTHVAGTYGYIAPELARNGKATTGTDVFAFGIFCLEVCCGKRPVEAGAVAEEVILLELVRECWRNGDILKTVDKKLENDYIVEEIELVFMVGLLCSHTVVSLRPSMSQVLQFLKGDAALPEDLDAYLEAQEDSKGPNDSVAPDHSHLWASTPSQLITESLVSVGR